MKSQLSLFALLTLLLAGACDPASSTQVLEADVSFGPNPLVLDLFFDETRTFDVSIQNRGDAYFSVLQTSQEETDSSDRVLIAFDQNTFAVPPGDSTFVLRVSPLSLGEEVGALVFDTEEGEIRLPFRAVVSEVPNCDDRNPCTRDRFDRALRVCISENLEDQSECEDGNACTENTQCSAGQCLGTPIECVDGVECTVDTCDPQVGCDFVPVNERCGDDNPCTEDICTAGGCDNPMSEAGTVCDFNGCETIGLCFLGICTDHAVPDGIPCEDGDPCTAGDTCQNAVCTSGAPADISATEPLTLELAMAYDPCPTSECNHNGWAEVDEVLALEVKGDETQLLWRGAFRNEGGQACAPSELRYESSNANVSEPDGDGVADEAPDPDPAAELYYEPFCRAAVFLTTHQRSQNVDAASTSEILVLVEGDVVGSLGDTWALAHFNREKNGVWLERPEREPFFYAPQLPTPLGTMAIDLFEEHISMIVTPSRRHHSPNAEPCLEGDCEACATCSIDAECGIGQRCYTANDASIGACIDPQRNTCEGGLGFHVTLESFWLRSDDQEYRSAVFVPEKIAPDCELGFNPDAPRTLLIEDLHLDADATGANLSLRSPFDGCSYLSVDPVFIPKETEAYRGRVLFEDSTTLSRPFANDVLDNLNDDGPPREHLTTIQFTMRGDTLTRVVESREEVPDGSVVSRRRFEASRENESSEQEVFLQAPLLSPRARAYSFSIEGQSRVALVKPDGFSVHDAEGHQVGAPQPFLVHTEQNIARDDESASLAMRATSTLAALDPPEAHGDAIEQGPLVIVQSFGCFSPPVYTECTSQADCTNAEHCEQICTNDSDDDPIDPVEQRCDGVCVPNDIALP